MNLKMLDNLKNFQFEEKEYIDLINSSFKFYVNHSNCKVEEEIKVNESKQKVFSFLLRFFRSLNSNKKFEEETFQHTLKDNLKDKPKAIALISEKVKEIYSVQSNRISFADKMTKRNFNYLNFTNFNNANSNAEVFVSNLESNIHRLKNFAFKLLVTISNNNSNRVLTPEIYLYLTLENGKTIEMFVNMKIFQELRKCLALHIKKMIDNESVNLLK